MPRQAKKEELKIPKFHTASKILTYWTGISTSENVRTKKLKGSLKNSYLIWFAVISGSPYRVTAHSSISQNLHLSRSLSAGTPKFVVFRQQQQRIDRKGFCSEMLRNRFIIPIRSNCWHSHNCNWDHFFGSKGLTRVRWLIIQRAVTFWTSATVCLDKESWNNCRPWCGHEMNYDYSSPSEFQLGFEPRLSRDPRQNPRAIPRWQLFTKQTSVRCPI